MRFTLSDSLSLPEWLQWFADAAAQAILDKSAHAPIGCHYYYDDERNEWEVTLFVSDTEVVGGPCDGTVIPCPIQLDVLLAMELFDKMPRTYWQSETILEDEDFNQHLSFEGLVRGHHVWLRILAQAPKQAGSGRLLHAETGELEELW
ncbi:MAG: hypothetical protein MK102_16980 [Fuerstiella sp.]|nr:hypothetical protein [Fuerstiella sp.]